MYSQHLTDVFWKCSGSIGCSQISKSLKNLCKNFSSSLTLRACSRISDFNKKDSNKNVSCWWSEIAGNMLRKDLYRVILLRQQDYYVEYFCFVFPIK